MVLRQRGDLPAYARPVQRPLAGTKTENHVPESESDAAAPPPGQPDGAEAEGNLSELKARLAQVTAKASMQVKAVNAEKATLEARLVEMQSRVDAVGQELKAS